MKHIELFFDFFSFKIRGLFKKQLSQKAQTNLTIVGLYIFSFQFIELLEHTAPGVNGEIRLTDALDELPGRQGLHAGARDAQIFDYGTKPGFLSANLALGMREPPTKSAIKILFDVSDC